jgi:DedD protein
MASASTDAAEIRRRGRQRLIGAIAIVLLLVVFVPMLLDSEPRKAADEPPLDIPSKDNAPPLPPPVPASAAPKMPEAPAATQDAVAPAKDAVAPAKDAVAPVKDRPSPQPSPKAEGANPPLEGFAVQVGAFRDEEKLKHARDKLAAAGVPHYTERLDTTSGGPLTRLRAGPFPTRQAADGAAAKLKAAQLPAQVVPLP